MFNLLRKLVRKLSKKTEAEKALQEALAKKIDIDLSVKSVYATLADSVREGYDDFSYKMSSVLSMNEAMGYKLLTREEEEEMSIAGVAYLNTLEDAIKNFMQLHKEAASKHVEKNNSK